MDKERAIQNGFMTVGEVAKKMGITVRTLQYYDRVGLLSPSAQSQGGRRLYTDKDLVELHQILSLKTLGFSLDDIKSRLVSLETPQEVADAMSKQAEEIASKIEALTESQRELLMLRQEVLQMQSVDFKKYADIIVNLKMKNENYRLIKYLDEKTLEHCRMRFDKDSGLKIMNTYKKLSAEIVKLIKDGVPPQSAKAGVTAKNFWDMIIEFTGGDMSLLPNLMEVGNHEMVDAGSAKEQAAVTEYIGKALEAYFSSIGYNPFVEVK